MHCKPIRIHGHVHVERLRHTQRVGRNAQWINNYAIIVSIFICGEMVEVRVESGITQAHSTDRVELILGCLQS